MKKVLKKNLYLGLIFLVNWCHAAQLGGAPLETMELQQLQRDQQNVQQGYEVINNDLASFRREVELPAMSPQMVAIGQKFQEVAVREYEMEEYYAQRRKARLQDLSEAHIQWVWIMCIDCILNYIFDEAEEYDAHKKEIRQKQLLLAQELDDRIFFEAMQLERLALKKWLANAESKLDDLGRAVQNIQADMAHVKVVLARMEQRTHSVEHAVYSKS